MTNATSTPDSRDVCGRAPQLHDTCQLQEQLAIQVNYNQFTVRDDTEWQQARGRLHKVYAETETQV
jgi:hypothetical protein